MLNLVGAVCGIQYTLYIIRCTASIPCAVYRYIDYNVLKEVYFEVLEKLHTFRSRARAAARGGRAFTTPSWAVLTPPYTRVQLYTSSTY
jgi:hypothetical protein